MANPQIAAAAPVYTSEHLLTYTSQLQTEVQKLINLETLDAKTATAAATNLRSVAEALRNDICTTRGDLSLKERLHKREIPFQFAHRMIQILVKEEIQCFDPLKYELSRVALIFLEFAVLQCNAEERRIYKGTIEKLRKDLEQVANTLPDELVETRFNLECAQAAVQKLDVGSGKWKEVAKDNAKPFLIALFQALLTLEKPGAGTVTPFVEPVVNLCADIYCNMEEHWYGKVWILRWYSVENHITTLAHLNAMEPHLNEFDKNPNLAFYISKIFFQIFNNPNADSQLKSAIFDDKPMSLLSLAELRDTRQLADTAYWQTRYLTLKHLGSIASNLEPNNAYFRTRSIDAIFKRWIREKAHVRALAGSTICELAPHNSSEWSKAHEKTAQHKDTLNLKLAEAATKRTQLHEEIQKLERLVTKATTRQEQSAGAKPINPDTIAKVNSQIASKQTELTSADAEVEAIENHLQFSNIVISGKQDWGKFLL